MSGEATDSGFAIEIRARYGDVARDRWLVSVDPLPEELLSSWIHRLALANGIAPRSFAGVLGLGGGMWSVRLDLRLPRHVAAPLGTSTDGPLEAISTMAMTDRALTPVLLPLRENARRNRSAWMQYYPLCLGEDEAPYFRRQWRLASRVSCFVHGCGLRADIPIAAAELLPSNQTELLPQHLCARCDFDLR
ncbi:TniQ family protein [Mesorhizobium sp. IMUNJ 23232]|uniref:TniQ family protein n=1 Tax=Mesorhizobium sp. IMUNJ 23232 TaxID=3376064 RepID=UPI00379FDFDB